MNSTENELPTYTPSGRLAARTIPVVLFLGLPVALLSGWIYAQIIVTSKWIPLSIFICAFASTIIALCITGVFKFSRSRSVRFNKYAAGFLAFVVLWARWITSLMEYGLPEAAANFAASGPIGWFHTFVQLVSHLQTISPDSVSWPFMIMGWALEMLFLISIVSTLSGLSADEAFSEVAGESAKKDFDGELFWPDGHSSGILALLRQRGASALLDFQRASELTAGAVASQWWTLRVRGKSVKSDPDARWLDLNLMEHTRDEKGKISSTRKPLLASLCISNADYASLALFLTGEATESAEASLETTANCERESISHTDRPTPLELEPAVTALQAENFGTALALAKPHCMHPEDAVRADAHRLCALAHARLQQWQDAFEHYHSLFEMEPTAFNAMQLATTSVTGGQLLRGHAWFERAEEINTRSNEIPQPRMRTHYISALEQAGEFAAAKPHLDWLADAYRLARTSDDHQLWCYGLPFFQEFLNKSLPILQACCSESDIREWYERIRPDLDDDGKDAIDRHLAVLT